MKYFDITLPKGIGSLSYPYKYSSEIGPHVADHVYYEKDEVTHLLVAIKDINATSIVRPSVVLLTEVEAKAISDANEKADVFIDNEAVVRLIELKAARGIALDPDDEKAIDPDDATTVGFSRRKRMYARIAKIAEAELIS